MRHKIIALSILALAATASVQAQAQVSVGVSIALPGVNIGINMPAYPRLVPVPGYPVYYDPNGRSNYFFYDSLYWVYQGDNWYASSWYNGPWDLISPAYVPVYVLRVPVRYYRQPPGHFRGWAPDASPRWGEHWGRDWETNRRGWDRWDRRNAPPPAPLPSYQRNYSGDRYPRDAERQQTIRSSHYRYRPREEVSQQYMQQRGRNTDQRGQQDAPQGQRPESGSPREQGMREQQQEFDRPDRNDPRQQQAERPGQMGQSMQDNQDMQRGMGRESPGRSPGQGRDDQRGGPKEGKRNDRERGNGRD